VKKTVFQIKHDKTSDLDAFSAKFYQNFRKVSIDADLPRAKWDHVEAYRPSNETRSMF
jgi:hypothetical protein